MADENGVSTLHAIRDAELAMARRVESARQAADAEIRAAKVAAREELVAARQRGRDAAERMLAEAIAEAEDDAGLINEAGAERAAALHLEVADRLTPTAEALLDLVLAPPSEEGT